MTSPASAAGISRDLARERAARVFDLSYRLDCRIGKRASVLHCRQEIRFRCERHAGEALLLDWRPQLSDAALRRTLQSLAINGRRSSRNVLCPGHLHIPARMLTDGENCIALQWQAPVADAGSALTRYRDAEDGAVYVYSLFVPADASTVFPCFDQPDLKARFSLVFTLPGDWNAIANAPIAQTTRINRVRRITFDRTEPISTYAFAFAVGPFTALDRTAAGDSTRLWVRRSQRRRAQGQARQILGLNREAVRYCTRYFDHRFPFGKYDLVCIPQFPYRGMEHAGATFLNEDAVLLPKSSDEGARFQRAQLIFHETAHQWMGDLVTMRWFDDLWIKEGFANFIAYKLAERVCSREYARLAFHDLKVSAYEVDATPGATALHHPLADLTQAKSAYNAIVYAKAPAVLRMLEHRIGAPVFRRGVRMLVREHAFGTVDWRELICALETVSGRSLQRWAGTWLLRTGAKTARRHDLAVDAQDYALPAPDGAGTKRALRALGRTRDALRRKHLWEYLWAAVLNCTLHPIRFVELAMAHGAAEPSELTVSRLTARLCTAVDRLLDVSEQLQWCPQVESLAWTASRAKGPAAIRLAWTRALISVSRTDFGYARLDTLLTGRRRALPDSDRLAAAAALIAAGRMDLRRGLGALRLDAGAKEHRLAARCLQAASPRSEDKRRVLGRWLDDSSLPDTWIDAALPHFNYPTHADLTLELLPRALDALPALERTRKIFFVNRWLASFIAGQRSSEALRVIRSTLAMPALGPHLRRKVLESAHALERHLAVYRRWHS